MNSIEEFIKSHLNDDPYELALQAAKYPEVDMQYVATQIRGWQTARRKLPLWAETEGIIYPAHISMEQCSSQKAAQYKAAIIARWLSHRQQDANGGGKPTIMADITGGFGVDPVMLGKLFDKVIYVEQNEELCRIACHNFPLLGLNNVEIINQTCEQALESLPHCDLIFLDPSRRDKNGDRTIFVEDCTPNILEIQDKLRQNADKVMVKVSPMFGGETLFRSCFNMEKLYIVSVNDECKEILVMMRGGYEKMPRRTSDEVIHCVNLTNKGTQSLVFTREEELSTQALVAQPADMAIGHYLYEPNASLMKGGAFRIISQKYHVRQLHNNTHLFTSPILVDDFPGRTFRITGMYSLNKKDCKQLHAIGKANIAVRNFPLSANDLRKRLKLAVGGDTYIFAVTLADESKAVIQCTRLHD